MAAKGGDGPKAKKASEFATLAGSKNPKEMTSKAVGKMVEKCWVPKYQKEYDVKAICDASVFPCCKEKGKQFMHINDANVDKVICKTAHEVAKKKKKNPKLPEDDAEVEEVRKDLEDLFLKGDASAKGTTVSKTGAVGRMTDTSQYTGSHKERFTTDGKGKGAAGRTDKVVNTGYVGAYKEEGTYDKKH